MKHIVLIADTGESYPCDAGENVLAGMARLGRRGIPLGCRGGGCGVCRVRVAQGRYESLPMSRAHVSVDDEARGCVLACRIRPASDLVLQVEGKLNKAVCAPRPGQTRPMFSADA